MGRKTPENVELKKANGLTVNDHMFCRAYVENGGNATKAAEIAFPGHEAPDQKGSRMLMRPEIVSAMEYHRIPVREMIQSLAPRALQRIQELSEQCSNPKVAYMASRDLADRAGYKEPERHETTVKIEISAPGWWGGGQSIIDVTPTHPALPDGEG